MPIAISLLAALVYGAADFLGGLASRRTSITSVVMWSQALGLLLLALVLPFSGGRPTAHDLAFGAGCGVAGAVAIAALYRGLAIGTMGVVSPLSAVLGAAIPVLWDIAVNRHRPPVLTYLGIGAALIAVVCVSMGTEPAPRRRGLPLGILEAIVAGIAFGAFFITLAQTNPAAGMYPLLAARVTSIILLVIGGLAVGGVASVRVARPALPLVFFGGLLDMSANVLYVVAAHSTMLAVVAVLTSLYPAATVALAALVLHERLNAVQWSGVALAFGGVIAITAAH